ncbi:hypothetical protein WJX73_007948 [Symbiochloris irregularis]|uniref:Uncharacterized protein n=1 Tax=Symbiochloris irregularis TaxID=706552 RepID=A0AAW1P5W8_9CHLO
MSRAFNQGMTFRDRGPVTRARFYLQHKAQSRVQRTAKLCTRCYADPTPFLLKASDLHDDIKATVQEVLVLSNQEHTDFTKLAPVLNAIEYDLDDFDGSKKLDFGDKVYPDGVPQGALQAVQELYRHTLVVHLLGWQYPKERATSLGSCALLSPPVKVGGNVQLALASAGHNFQGKGMSYIFNTNLDVAQLRPSRRASPGFRDWQLEEPAEELYQSEVQRLYGPPPYFATAPAREASLTYGASGAVKHPILDPPNAVIFVLEPYPNKAGHYFPYIITQWWQDHHSQDFVVPAAVSPLERLVTLTGMPGDVLESIQQDEGLLKRLQGAGVPVEDVAGAMPERRAAASPGKVVGYEKGFITHLCSCVAGMSGGPLRLLEHPHAFVGLHLGGEQEEVAAEIAAEAHEEVSPPPAPSLKQGL